MIALVDAAMRQGSTQTMRTDYPLVYAPGNLPNVQVVLVDGRPVATAPVLPRRIQGDGFGFGLGVISPTATDPAHQHRGYGSACVAACVSRMEALGLELSALWTQVATFPFYELNGWQAVARYGRTYRLGAAHARGLAPWSGRVGTLADDGARVAEVLALHDSVAPGVARSADQAAALFALPKMTMWLAMADDRIAGYLLESRATNKPGLLEAAGEPEAIEGLVRHVLEGLAQGQSVEMHVGFAPDGLASLADRAFAAVSAVQFDGNVMIRLNDPAAFVRAVRPWLAARAAPWAGSVSIGIVDADVNVGFEWSPSGLEIGSRPMPDHVELTRRELTSVLFGSHPARPVQVPPSLAWLPQFHLPIPVLDRS